MNKLRKLILISIITIPNSVMAADSNWAPIYDKLEPWVKRAGILLVVIGAIDFATSISNDEAASKVKGVAKMASGGVLLGAWVVIKTVFPF